MPDISTTLTWDKNTLRNQTNMNANDDALIAGLSDGTKDINVNKVIGPLIGNATTTDQVVPGGTISLTGDFTGSALVDGTSDVNLSVVGTQSIKASCGITFGLSKEVEEVLLNHATDTDLDGNNTLDTWGHFIRYTLSSRNSTIATCLSNSTIWGYLFNNPLSTEEAATISNNTNYIGISNSHNVTSVTATDVTVSNDNPIIVDLDPSLGTDPYAYDVLTNSTISLENSSSDYNNPRTSHVDNLCRPFETQSSKARISLNRNSYLYPTHLQLYFYQTPKLPYARSLLLNGYRNMGYEYSEIPGWPSGRNSPYSWSGAASLNSNVVAVLQKYIDRINALKATYPARATEYDTLSGHLSKAGALGTITSTADLPYYSDLRNYGQELYKNYTVYGNTEFPTTLFLPNELGTGMGREERHAGVDVAMPYPQLNQIVTSIQMYRSYLDYASSHSLWGSDTATQYPLLYDIYGDHSNFSLYAGNIYSNFVTIFGEVPLTDIFYNNSNFSDVLDDFESGSTTELTLASMLALPSNIRFPNLGENYSPYKFNVILMGK